MLTVPMARQRVESGPPGFTAGHSVYASRRSYRPPGGSAAPSRPVEGGLRGYDPRWPRIFAAERRRVVAALGPAARAVEHVGSSSVPGLSGRAEIDILVGVGDAGDVRASADRLASIGYRTLACSPPESEPYRLLTRHGSIPFELLVVEHGSALWRRHLGLRDHLRADPERARAYGRLKSRWAARHGADTAGYKEAKRRFWAAVELPSDER
jgi:GrpB-like predicted nucleotidyltransferase (UPF0157 family)